MQTITNRQIVFLLFTTLTGVSLTVLPKYMAVSAEQGAWLTILLTALIFAVMTAVIVKLGRMYEGRTLFEYSGEIVGGFIKYVMSVFYMLYFLLVLIYLCSGFTALVHYEFLLNTPEWGILLVATPVLGFVAYKGLRNIVRILEIIGILFIVVNLIIIVTMFLEGRANYILPLYDPARTADYFASIKDAFTSFLGIEILMLVPFSSGNKKAPKIAFFTLIGIGLFYILAVEGSYVIIGLDEIVNYSDPLIVAIRLVQYPTIEFLQRVDIVYMTLGFISVFCCKAVAYMAVIDYMCKIIPKIKRVAATVFTGIFIFLGGLGMAGIQDAQDMMNAAVGFSGIATAFVFPLFLFAVAKVKRHVQKSR